MLFRRTSGGMLAITQPAHAWVSGQLARAWGNDVFARPEPWEEVCLAAEQHDIGWLPWESRPTWNPSTGLPHSFLELPLRTHLELWSNAPTMALALGRYVALLVSLHGTFLYGRHGPSGHSEQDWATIRAYLNEQALFQDRVLNLLRADPDYRSFADSHLVDFNQRLLAVWDYMSLLLCWGLSEPKCVGEVPRTHGSTTLLLVPGPRADTVAVSPWPFGQERVQVVIDARLISASFASEEQMLDQLFNAPWVRLRILLMPGESAVAERSGQ